MPALTGNDSERHLEGLRVCARGGARWRVSLRVCTPLPAAAAPRPTRRTMYTLSGMVGASGWMDHVFMPSSQKREAPPMTAVPGRKERE